MAPRNGYDCNEPAPNSIVSRFQVIKNLSKPFLRVSASSAIHILDEIESRVPEKKGFI